MTASVTRQPPVIYGIALVAGGTVGAGMFSLPIVSAGMWFGWAVLALTVAWSFNYVANLLLLEANLLQPAGSSFDTIVKNSAGRRWATINNVGIAFVMYILLYAYFSAGGSIVVRSFANLFDGRILLSQNLAGLFFGCSLAILVWLGTRLVSRVCVVIMVAMIVAFIASNFGLVLHVEAIHLFEQQSLSLGRTAYLWAALPYFVTAFACAGLLPSLVKFYGHAPRTISRCIRDGTLIALAAYVLWLVVCFGTLDRDAYAPLIAAGGNMGELVAALQSGNRSYSTAIGLFSNFAITSSFLSIGLGLFDFLADRFKFQDDLTGRSKTALCAFAPPAIFSFFYPHGFVSAIGYAGLVVIFSFYLIPVLMAVRNRGSGAPMSYQVAGGSLLLVAIVLFSVAAAAAKILAAVDLLPIYPD